LSRRRPSLAVVFELEDDAPYVIVDCVSDSEFVRLADWIESHPDFADLLDALLAAIEKRRAT
jgi:hypothetical protein